MFIGKFMCMCIYMQVKLTIKIIIYTNKQKMTTHNAMKLIQELNIW
jgi:uncharacterized membrane protein YjfL (UPF0719 family)